jgi:hypothetical protein
MNGFTVEVLKDGTIKMESGDLSGTGHYSAEEFVRRVEGLAGGKVDVEKLAHSHHHTHSEQHVHATEAE